MLGPVLSFEESPPQIVLCEIPPYSGSANPKWPRVGGPRPSSAYAQAVSPLSVCRGPGRSNSATITASDDPSRDQTRPTTPAQIRPPAEAGHGILPPWS